jgi:hypothetical protein
MPPSKNALRLSRAWRFQADTCVGVHAVFGRDFVGGSALLDDPQGQARFEFRAMLSPAFYACFFCCSSSDLFFYLSDLPRFWGAVYPLWV